MEETREQEVRQRDLASEAFEAPSFQSNQHAKV
jgi:hypothetical protein